MAVVIRLKRTGRRNRPCYRISVADSRWLRDGRTLENLGLYDPIARNVEAQHTLNVERARHWLSVGARPSITVRSLFKRHGVYEGELELGRTKRKKVRSRKPTRTAERKRTAKQARTQAKAERREARKVARRADARAAAAADGGEE